MQPITASPGIYFDNIGKLKISSGRLNVLIPLDISYFEPYIQNINSAISTITYLCKQTTVIEEVNCHNAIEPLMAQYQNIVKLFGSISHLTDNRTRRGAWIGGIGSILKQIFGTLDENDAVKYDEAIESVQNNEKKLTSLVRNSILVTSSIISTYNTSLYKIKQNEINLNKAIDNLSVHVKNLSIISDSLELRTNANFILNILDTSMTVLSLQLEDIINAIMFCSQNILHPAIMPPAVMHRELADNSRHLPSDLQFPVNLDLSTIHVIIRISRLICYYYNYKIVFILQVPLVNNKEYTLFNSIALPTPHNPNQPDTFSLIIPGFKYVAMTKDKANYCNLDSLDNCKLIGQNNFICDVPIIYKSDSKPSCESELMSKIVNHIPKQCETRFIYGKVDIWKPLSNNRWIYLQSDSTKLSVDCQNLDLYELNILGLGIFTIPSQCKAYSKGTTLIPKFYNVLNITTPVNQPTFNLINDTCCKISKVISIISNMSPTQLENINLDDIKSNKNLLNKLFLDSDKILETPHILKYGTHYSIITYVIISIIIVFVLCKIIFFFYRPGRNLRKNKSLRNKKIPTQSDSIELETHEVPAPALRISV